MRQQSLQSPQTKTLHLLSYFYIQRSQIIEFSLKTTEWEKSSRYLKVATQFQQIALNIHVTLSSSIFDWKIVLITKIFYSNRLLIGSVLSAKLTTSETIK